MVDLVGTDPPAAAACTAQFVDGAATQTGPIDRLGLFGYRTGVLESEVIKPLVLCCSIPSRTPIPGCSARQGARRRRELDGSPDARARDHEELQPGRRRARHPAAQGRSRGAGDVIEAYLAGQSSASRYWPDDAEVREELGTCSPIVALAAAGFAWCSKRSRITSAAGTDGRRAWRASGSLEGSWHIEHVMPRKWPTHWPLPDGATRGRPRSAHPHARQPDPADRQVELQGLKRAVARRQGEATERSRSTMSSS